MELLAKAPVLSCGGKRGAGGAAGSPMGMGPLVGALGRWIHRVVQPPPPPRVCGTPGGPPVTAPRVRLRDGRHLAYAESGVRKEEARYKVVFSHGFTGSREDSVRASPEVAEELGVYMVGFDRAGYGESDPNPNRSVKSAALDVEELADALGLGPKFYVIGISLGCHAVWGALKYIPHRIAGAAMMAPVVNYWWPGFPADLAAEVYSKQEVGDQWALRVSHYAPGILHWWMEQSWLPTSTVVANTTHLPNTSVARRRDPPHPYRRRHAPEEEGAGDAARHPRVVLPRHDGDVREVGIRPDEPAEAGVPRAPVAGRRGRAGAGGAAEIPRRPAQLDQLPRAPRHRPLPVAGYRAGRHRPEDPLRLIRAYTAV